MTTSHLPRDQICPISNTAGLFPGSPTSLEFAIINFQELPIHVFLPKTVSSSLIFVFATLEVLSGALLCDSLLHACTILLLQMTPS